VIITDTTLLDNTTAGNGGAISNYAAAGDGTGTATLLVTGSTFDQNQAAEGGAIYDAPGATAFIANSTLSGNRAGDGGAVYDFTPELGLAAGTFLPADVQDTAVIITNSTLSDNTGSGAALSDGSSVQPQELAARSTILDDANECSSAIGDDGHNLMPSEDTSCGLDTSGGSGDVFQDPGFGGELANNGGLTDTIALGAGSAAIGAGDCKAEGGGASSYSYPQVSTDQRGYPRGTSGASLCDIGAFEHQIPPATPTWTRVVQPQQPVRAIPPTQTPIPSNTATATSTATATGTATATSTPTSTFTPTLTQTASPTLTATATPTLTATATAMPTPPLRSAPQVFVDYYHLEGHRAVRMGQSLTVHVLASAGVAATFTLDLSAYSESGALVTLGTSTASTVTDADGAGTVRLSINTGWKWPAKQWNAARLLGILTVNVSTPDGSDRQRLGVEVFPAT
jgi:hypothetical protein